jgi:hypothetical protein
MPGKSLSQSVGRSWLVLAEKSQENRELDEGAATGEEIEAED